MSGRGVPWGISSVRDRDNISCTDMIWGVIIMGMGIEVKREKYLEMDRNRKMNSEVRRTKA